MHNGAIRGFQTINATFPDDGMDIIVLTNDGSNLDPYFIIPQVFPLALDESKAVSHYAKAAAPVMLSPKIKV